MSKQDMARALNPPGDASWATFAMHVARERDALEDRLEQMTRERDEAKKEAAESFKEMVMLYNDHSSTELEQQLRIEELTRERDEARAQLAALATKEKP